MENGIPIHEVKSPMWCAPSGLCSATHARCAIVKTTRCERADAFACFDHKTVTDGKEHRSCFRTYRLCSDVSNYINQDIKSRDVTDCAIFRVKKKR